MPIKFFIVKHDTYENCNAIFTSRKKAEKYISKAIDVLEMEWKECNADYDNAYYEKDIFHIYEVTEGRTFDGDLSDLSEKKCCLKDFEKTLYKYDIKDQKAKYSLCCNEILFIPPNKSKTFLGGIHYLQCEMEFNEKK